MSSHSPMTPTPMVPRCKGCGYVLIGLERGRCPECGREFDPADSATFSSKPPFVRWRYWAPVVLLIAVVAATAGVATVYFFGYGIATVFVLPICLGCILGFGLRLGKIASIVLGAALLSVLIAGLVSTDQAGLFCATSCVIVMLGPTVLGILFGTMLRLTLKRSNWDQRWHLPVMMALVVLPMLCAGIERLLVPRPFAVEEIRTTEELPIGVNRMWNEMMFYEQVKLPAPLLLRTILPRPLYTTGAMLHVGDRKVCVYTTGRLVKLITSVKQDQRLDFAVTEQTNVENQSVRLIGGSFAFTPIDATHTRLTLSTRYEPKLAPRWVWRPFETLGMGTLHRFVMEGMAQKAEETADVFPPGPAR